MKIDRFRPKLINGRVHWQKDETGPWANAGQCEEVLRHNCRLEEILGLFDSKITAKEIYALIEAKKRSSKTIIKQRNEINRLKELISLDSETLRGENESLRNKNNQLEHEKSSIKEAISELHFMHGDVDDY